MGFLLPAAFALAALIPVIIAMYLLKLRRTEQVVSSTYLWRHVVRDVQANAPWQRLRRNLLLVLQILFLIALILALARPFTWTAGAASSSAILVFDTSASMAATDQAPNRLAAAAAHARDLVATLPADARITVIAAGDAPRVLLASSRDRRAADSALSALRPGTGGSDMTTALELAAALAARQPDTEVVVYSDGRATWPGALSITGRVRYVPLGSGGDNQAIAVLSLRPDPTAGSVTAFAQVVNYGATVARGRLNLYADGQLVAAHDLEIPPGGQQAVLSENLPASSRVVEAQLTEQDALDLDDRAWAVYGAAEPAPVILVSEGNLFLETALALLPGLQVTVVEPADWDRAAAEGEVADLTILDAYVPLTATLPAGNLLFIAPPRSTAYFTVTGTVEQPRPRPADAGDPLLAHVDLDPEAISVLNAARIALPAWARPVIVGDPIDDAGDAGSVPLLFAGEVDARRVAVLAFDLHRSDLPLQVAFPLLLSNLTSWLAPGPGGGLPDQTVPGAPVAIPVPPEAGSVSVTRPDGSTARLIPEGRRALFADTSQLGVYQVAWQVPEGDPLPNAAFVANLFAPQESDLSAAPVPVLTEETSAASSAGTAQREWWRPLAWIAIALLLIEWLVYYRATLSRIAGRWQVWKAGTSLSVLPIYRSTSYQISQFPNSPIPQFPLSFLHPTALLLLLLVPFVIALALLSRRRPRPTRFWAGLAVRVVLLLLVILSLAGTRFERRADTLTAVFVLDASDSIPAEEQEVGENLIRAAIETMPRGDRAAVVVFGEDALVERLPSTSQMLSDLASVPVTARTDVAGALQLALALFPDEGARRLVLLSDGRQNVGDAILQAELAAAHGVELAFVPLGAPAGEVEVRVEELDAPADVRQGQEFDLTVIVDSTARVDAALHVLGDGQLIHSQEVRLQPGTNRFLVPVEADEAGFRRFRAQVIPDADTWLQNNEASAFAVVHGPPSVLLVEGAAGDGDNLASALRAAEMNVSVVDPASLPATLPELAGFDAVVLANVPAIELPAGTMDSLQVYVRDLGKGLLMTGGDQSFGAGGYLRTALEDTLPVDMDVRTKEQTPNLALVLAVDKSGSMGRCHCDNPDLNQSYVRQEVGQPKVDIAKEAIMRAAAALGPLDYLGVVAFDTDARWAVDLAPVSDPAALEQSIGAIEAVGQTNLRAGVEAAYASLQDVDARLKHVILLTDGWVHTGELTALARQMQEQGVTLSVVAAGEGSAEYLETLAYEGGGRYYPAEDILRVPDFFLKETVQAVGEYIVEEAFYPLPSAPGTMLRGLDVAALPPLFGYNGTTPKGTSRVVLSTPRGDPLLATWQYGLGRAAVWTSDLKGQWASEWLEWPGFARFASQLVGWTLPAPAMEGIAAETSLSAEGAAIRVEATTDDGQPRNFLDVTATLIGPDLEATRLSLPQAGAGRYEALAGISQPGTYLVRLEVRDGDEVLGQQTLGLVVPYSPEYRAAGTDRPFLEELARITGGGPLPEPAAAFVHDLPPAGHPREVWPTLLLIAALLFPLDVALRRLVLTRADVARAREWLRTHLPTRGRQATRTERALGQLFTARDRARERTRERGTSPDREEPAPPPRPDAPVPPSDTQPAAKEPKEDAGAPAEGDQDSLSRLRRAKERARRRE
ncbi:MAG TPA: VWA domain-containing protein [Anaerolineae bacterium]|nr:VWA domain-containing protein [Anaerolineae bacterium]